MLFLEALKTKRLFFDGAMGTELQRRMQNSSGDPMLANIYEPEAVTEIHRMYRRAGSDAVTANTFGAYPHKYENYKDIIKAALQNARRAADGLDTPPGNTTHGKNARSADGYVALDMGPTGRLIRPMGEMTFDECFEIYRQTAQAGAECGADFILIETMTDLYETKCALLAAKETGLPVVATVTLDERGRMLTGADLRCAAALFEGLGADAMGVNCGLGPDVYVPIVSDLLKITSLPVLVQPNAGLPEIIDGKAVYKLPPEAFAKSMAQLASMGVNLMGGCCGTSPEHISAMKNACGAVPFAESNAPAVKRVSSGAKSVEADGSLKLERCLSTQAEDIIDEALEFDEADVISITVSDTETVVAVQEIIRAPLLLEAASAEALREAVRVYNGVPMVAEWDESLRQYGAVLCGKTHSASAGS